MISAFAVDSSGCAVKEKQLMKAKKIAAVPGELDQRPSRANSRSKVEKRPRLVPAYEEVKAHSEESRGRQSSHVIQPNNVLSFPQQMSDAQSFGNRSAYSGIVDAILEVGSRRMVIMCQLKSALLAENDSEALGLARQLCGLGA
jgi:hypothetical protein